MERRIIGRGLLAGALAGLFAFLYARVLIEPVIGRAIAYEGGRGDADAAMTGMHGHDMELFTRDAVLGGHGVRGAGLQRRHGRTVRPGLRDALSACSGSSARMTALLLAGTAFVTVYLCRSRSTRPTALHRREAGHHQERSGLYLLMILLSVAPGHRGAVLGPRLAPKLGAWVAGLTAVGAYVVAAVAVVMWVLPGIAETLQPLTDPAADSLPRFPRR